MRSRLSDRPILFMIVCELLVLLLYSAFELVSPQVRQAGPVVYALTDAAAAIAIPLALAFILKRSLGSRFVIGFGCRGLKEGLLLSVPLFVLGAVNYGIASFSGASAPGTPAVIALIGALRSGVSEEIQMRGIICGNMMRAYGNSRMRESERILRAQIISSVFFGLTHLINIAAVGGMTDQILWQIVYASAAGFLFAGIFLRTGNLWGVIAGHTFFDFCAFLCTSANDTQQAVIEALRAPVTGAQIANDLILIVCGTVIGFYLTRKSKRHEIAALWDDTI